MIHNLYKPYTNTLFMPYSNNTQTLHPNIIQQFGPRDPKQSTNFSIAILRLTRPLLSPDRSANHNIDMQLARIVSVICSGFVNCIPDKDEVIMQNDQSSPQHVHWLTGRGLSFVSADIDLTGKE